jgi:hypothetical protein
LDKQMMTSHITASGAPPHPPRERESEGESARRETEREGERERQKGREGEREIERERESTPSRACLAFPPTFPIPGTSTGQKNSVLPMFMPTPSCPFRCWPQHLTPPFATSAHVWAYPKAMAVAERPDPGRGGGVQGGREVEGLWVGVGVGLCVGCFRCGCLGCEEYSPPLSLSRVSGLSSQEVRAPAAAAANRPSASRPVEAKACFRLGTKAARATPGCAAHGECKAGPLPSKRSCFRLKCQPFDHLARRFGPEMQVIRLAPIFSVSLFSHTNNTHAHILARSHSFFHTFSFSHFLYFTRSKK